MSAVLAPSENHLTSFETAFVQTVLEHRGVFGSAGEADFIRAFEVLRRYDRLCLANPRYESGWAPELASDDMASLRAKAFMMFDTITPSPAQWHKAHKALFGPLLCETCG